MSLRGVWNHLRSRAHKEVCGTDCPFAKALQEAQRVKDSYPLVVWRAPYDDKPLIVRR